MSTVQEKLRSAQKPAQKPAPVVEVAPETTEVDPWAFALEEATYVPGFTRGPVVDIERDIPANLRTLFESVYADFHREVSLPDGSKIPAGVAKFRELNVGSLEKAKQFVNFARKWARYRRVDGQPNDGQLSASAFQKKHADGGESSTVRFTFQPLRKTESRTVTSGASDGLAAKVREWAKGKGLNVPERGRVSQELKDQYLAENPPADKPVEEVKAA